MVGSIQQPGTGSRRSPAYRALVRSGVLALPIIPAMMLPSCGHSDRGRPPAASESEQDPASSLTSDEGLATFSARWRREEAERRRANDAAITARFEGEFVGGGLPSEPTQAIPLDAFDNRFLLAVRVTRLIEGQLPEGWSNELTFAVHSPTLFFMKRGLRRPEGRNVPSGLHCFTLWREPDGRARLDVETID